MEDQLTITHSAMRGINRSAILEIIRRQSPISRTAIAERLELSLPTVMRIVDELAAEGFVRPQGTSEWSGGRRRALLEFNGEAQVVIGVDLGGTNMFGAMADLAGNIVDEVDIRQHGTGGDGSLVLLCELIDRLLASPRLSGRRVRGIGVGAPGITRHREGVVNWAYTLKWENYPLKARLASHYGIPITVDNDVNLAALGELWFGAGQDARNMVVLAIGTGIGAGIILDGALYRGAHEASGEIGNMIPGREFLGKRYAEFGALESAASGTGIAARARQALAGRCDSATLATLVSEDVFEAARQRQDWAGAIIEETVDYLALAVANLATSLDPELIVIGGGVSGSADMLIDPILQRIDGCIPSLPRLVVSRLGRRAAVMGAIVNVLHNTTEFYQVRRLT
ncbi:MAG TPA: ROK family transcriptional regulator [Anaerolineae bacterium]